LCEENPENIDRPLIKNSYYTFLKRFLGFKMLQINLLPILENSFVNDHPCPPQNSGRIKMLRRIFLFLNGVSG